MAFLSHNRGQNDSPNPLKNKDLSVDHMAGHRPSIFGFIRYVSWFDFFVITYGVGIAVYFSIGSEPSSLILSLISLIVFAACLSGLWLRRDRNSFAPILFLGLYMAVGFLSASLHTKSANTAFFPDYSRAYTVTGWIAGQDKGRTGPRFMVRIIDIEGQNQLPKDVRIRGNRNNDLAIGDFVTVRAVMTGPPYPATPDGYNSRRAAFYKGLGGSGYAVEPFLKTAPHQLSFKQQVSRGLLMFRYNLAQRIKINSSPETAGLQAALITGLRQDIAPHQVDALRASGLAHVLAISGLHMALFAGSFYSLMSLCFASIPALARGRDIRKFAAFAGICAATLYLLVSGGSVATQRAFIMAVILFLAVILDRQALSTRSVSLAALITLLLSPESLLSVGFQMSFAAVLALVVVYRHWADWQAQTGWVFERGILIRLRNGFTSLSVTSLVAGFATGLFAIMQFQRWAKYGLLGNLAAMPIFTLLVMPMALVTFLLLPLGLERYPLWIMGQGLEQLLWVATRIEGFPDAMLAIKKPPPFYIALYTMCFLLICLGRIGLKVIAIIAAIFLAFIWVSYPSPVVRVSDQGRVTWQSDEGVYFTRNRRADQFGRNQFLRGNGDPEGVIERADQLDQCDAQGCILNLKGQTLAIIETPDLLSEACETASLVILQKRDAGPRAKYLCKAEIIDQKELSRTGALDIYVTDQGWTRRAARPANGSRPWD